MIKIVMLYCDLIYIYILIKINQNWGSPNGNLDGLYLSFLCITNFLYPYPQLLTIAAAIHENIPTFSFHLS